MIDSQRLRPNWFTRQVSVIAVAGGTPSAMAAKAATAAVPIVFGVAADPVELGLASLNRPGGNVTGVTNMNIEVAPKRLELLHALVPSTSSIGLLVNPSSPSIAEPFERAVMAAARALGRELHVLQASNERDLETAFSSLGRLRVGGLVIMPDIFFNSWSEKIAALTVQYSVAAIYHYRKFVEAGGLVSYGSSETNYYRLVGAYVGRILKGEKPADLPVQQATKIELIINLRAAKALGITLPPTLLAQADDVIE
jgi:putative ABC transport system substrate-binding protein